MLSICVWQCVYFAVGLLPYLYKMSMRACLAWPAFMDVASRWTFRLSGGLTPRLPLSLPLSLPSSIVSLHTEYSKHARLQIENLLSRPNIVQQVNQCIVQTNTNTHVHLRIRGLAFADRFELPICGMERELPHNSAACVAVVSIRSTRIELLTFCGWQNFMLIERSRIFTHTTTNKHAHTHG